MAILNSQKGGGWVGGHGPSQVTKQISKCLASYDTTIIKPSPVSNKQGNIQNDYRKNQESQVHYPHGVKTNCREHRNIIESAIYNLKSQACHNKH